MRIEIATPAAASFALALVFAGCSSEGPTGGAGTGTAAATSPTSSGSALLPADGVGKPACDAYLAKMRACIDKLPEADRAPKKDVLEKTLAAWREQAQRPEMQQNLETTCRAAAAALDTDPLCK